VIMEPGTTLPEASRTTPAMAPLEIEFCAVTGKALRTNNVAERKARCMDRPTA